MARERGSGVTPERVTDLLKKEVSEKSILAVSKATGLGLAAIGRYLKGIGEPTTATLQKLASYFGVSVAYLRGEHAFDSISEEIRRGASIEGHLFDEALIHSNRETVLDLEAGIRKFPKLWEEFDSLTEEDKREALAMFKSYANLTVAGMRDFTERNIK